MSSNANELKMRTLGLRSGEKVVVKSAEEIFATLDSRGTLDGMPFMPEMLPFCGQEFTVYKRADKTCDTIEQTGGRRLFDTVHLDELRCDGKSHGDCDASCLLFWKEAWLKRTAYKSSDLPLRNILFESGEMAQRTGASGRSGCSEDTVRQYVYRDPSQPASDNPAYSCQTTQLLEATIALPWWDIRQYMRDILSGNVNMVRMIRTMVIALFRNLSKPGYAYRAIIWAYNKSAVVHKGVPWPYRWGSCDKTPKETLGLEPGDLVEVKSYEEILSTLDKRNRNRGLYFDAEMVPFCGKRYRVAKRVSKILDEKTGEVVRLPSDCVILNDVFCTADYSQKRLFCPRAIYPYWREIWLKRVNNA